jgi:DNA-directed RNA polymerase subunit omega
MSDSRARYTSEEAVNMVGNRFDLILIASTRVRELKRGYKSKIPASNDGHTVTALKEIEKGLVGRDYLKKLKN